MPLIASLARSYKIPRKLDEDDIIQELEIVLWKLTKRVDPVSSPDDFRKLIKTEMKNRCIDLTRFYRAQKRASKIGKGLHCLECVHVTPIETGMSAVCEFCGLTEESSKTKVIDHFMPDVSINHEDAKSGGVSIDILENIGVSKPDENLLFEETLKRVLACIEEYPDRELFMIYANPSMEFVDFLTERGYAANPSKAPYWLIAKYMGNVTEKVLRMAHTRIAIILAQISNRPELIERLSKYNLRQVGFLS